MWVPQSLFKELTFCVSLPIIWEKSKLLLAGARICKGPMEMLVSMKVSPTHIYFCSLLYPLCLKYQRRRYRNILNLSYQPLANTHISPIMRLPTPPLLNAHLPTPLPHSLQEPRWRRFHHQHCQNLQEMVQHIVELLWKVWRGLKYNLLFDWFTHGCQHASKKSYVLKFCS